MTAPLLLPASELRPEEVHWLWPGCLAEGELAMLDGDPGIGKSLFTLDLAARLTTGRPFPDGAASPGRAPALIICAEDGEATILSRLDKLDVDRERFFAWTKEHDLPSLPSQAADLDDAIARTGARLVVLDPIVHFLDKSVQIAGDASIRRALAPLAAIAQNRRCAMVLVRHLNKQNGAPALYRGGGSIAFVGVCRLAWLAAPDPRVTGRYVLAQQKNNLAPLQPSLAYTLPADGPRLQWLGESVWRAEDLGRRCRRPLLQRACEFLRAFLEQSARPVSEIWDAAQASGITDSTLRRAKDELRIRSQRVVRGPDQTTYWLMPTQMLPEELQGPLDKYLQPVIEEWGNQCPLEREEDDSGGDKTSGSWEADEQESDDAA